MPAKGGRAAEEQAESLSATCLFLVLDCGSIKYRQSMRAFPVTTEGKRQNESGLAAVWPSMQMMTTSTSMTMTILQMQMTTIRPVWPWFAGCA